MRYVGGHLPTVELTRRNLEVLLAKLDDPLSARTLVDGSGLVQVKAVENEEHYADRDPGEVYMPSTGERY
jgi:hypothetical protein